MNRYAPQETYMKNVVKGNDPYHRLRPKRSIYRSYAILLALIFLAVFGTLLLVARVAR